MSDLDESNIQNIANQFSDDDFVDLISVYEGAKDEIPADCLECLIKVFGHTNFRDMQWKIISSVMNDKRDNCVVMATGYGKSLCYQFPSVYLNTVTIIVSPLISLMEDQVLSLELNNIKGCLLGTAQRNKSILSDVLCFKYNLVYCTPEFLTGQLGLNLLKTISPRLQMVAIDEAHCISKWGHDFRSSFRYLDIIRKTIPSIPILAMTATATDNIRIDICKCLQLKNPQILCTGFDRPNLEFHVKEKSISGAWTDIEGIIKSVKIGSIIIYCLTRQSTEDLCTMLQSHKMNCAAYHAGLSIIQRKKIHEDFVKDKVQIIVATTAFGMGIDKPDVRIIIHYGVSRDMESYYQEVGRAGRDGMPAQCFMFHCRADWNIHVNLREKSFGTNESKENSNKLSMKMKEYVNILECRRTFIINYFENGSSTLKRKEKNCCDNCNLKGAEKKLSCLYENLNNDELYDFSYDAKNLFKSIEVFNGFKGLNTVILFLRGAKRQALNENYYKHKLFGIGKDKTEEWYKLLADLLELNDYIEKKTIQNNNFGSKNVFYNNAKTVAITKKAQAWLNNSNHEPILLKPNKSLLKFMKRKPIIVNSSPRINNTLTPESSKDKELLIASLYKVRENIANEMNVMPYMVLSNKAIHQLAQICPLSLEELKASKLDGFSDAKVNKFGQLFLKCVLKFKNFLPANENLSNVKKSLMDFLAECPLPSAKPLTGTLLATYELFKIGMPLTEIALKRNLANSTINSYFNEIIKNGLIISKLELQKLGITEDKFKIITEKLQQFDVNTAKLTAIKEICPPTIYYDNIKFVLSYHQIRNHIKTNRIPFNDPDDVIKDTTNSSSSSSIVKKVEKSLTCSNVQAELQTDETIHFDSDDDFDFSQIDYDVNNSIIESTSEIVKDEKNIIQSVKSNIQNPAKRKVNIGYQMPSINYLDDSSDEESCQKPDAKRKLPGWLTK